jgi:hypothetical protein
MARKIKKTKKSKGRSLIKVTSPVKKDAAFFVASELTDDKLIGQELLGQTTKTLVYQYQNEDGDIVRGLSVVGVREAVRVINRDRGSGHIIQISDKPPIIERDITMYGAEGVEVQIYAVDVEGGGGSWGIKFEPWQRHTGDGKGSTSYNRFALETALSKAQRNAMFSLLPADLVEKLIEKFAKSKDAVMEIKAPATDTRAVKPKETSDDKFYASTVDRIGKVKDNKEALEQALANVDKMPISTKQRAQIRRKIAGHIKKIK